MKPRVREFARLLAALLTALPALATAAGAIEPVPIPELSTMDPVVAEQLETAWRGLDVLSGAAPDAQARAYGEFGKVCLLYELNSSAEVSLSNARELEPEVFEWTYFLGYGRQQSGDLAGASEALARAAELDADYLPARQRLGEVELDRGRAEVAREIFEGILEQDPDYAAARYGLGKIHLLTGDFEGAARHLEAVVAAQPEASTAHYQLGLAYRGLGDRERARAALSKHGRSRVTFRDPLVERVDELGRGKGLPLTIAVAARQGGDYDTAITSFRAALDTDPQDISARSGLVATLLDAGFPDTALTELEEILRLEPDNVYALFASGKIRAERGEFAAALPHLQRAIELESEVAQTLGFLGYVHAQLGQLEEAEAAYGRALELEGANTQILMRRATVRNDLGRTQGALEDLQALLAIEPDNPSGLQASASLYARLGRFAEAAATFEALQALRPEDLQIRFGRGLALLLAGDYPAAIDHLEQSAATLPGATPIEHLLARVLATVPRDDLQDPARALTMAQAIMQAEPTIEHAETVAMALAAAGRFGDAASLQQQVLDQSSGGSQAQRDRLALYRESKPAREPWKLP